MPTMKTPGVYIVEENAFPNSVVQVPSSIAAFVGYTERVLHGMTPLLNRPTLVKSMAQFVEYFGARYLPSFKILTEGEALLNPLVENDPLPQAVFKTKGATYQLVEQGVPFGLFEAVQHFFQNGGGECYVVSVGDFNAEAIDPEALKAGIKALEKEKEPALLVVPETTRLSASEAISVQQEMLEHCGVKVKNRFAILDMHGGYKPLDEDPVEDFRSALNSDFLSSGAVYYPWVHSTLSQPRQFSFSNLEKASWPLLVDLLKASLSTPDAAKTVEIERILTSSQAADDPSHDTLDMTLRAIAPLYTDIMEALRARANSISPGAAMAGIMATVDGNRGVWKAPANVSLTGVSAPLVPLSHAQQDGLNVSTDGKSVNAIREFAGQGTLVWGARTLAGNSLDWRYINVRRSVIMIQESIRCALASLVFEPNSAATWNTVSSMLDTFLTGVWKQGGLSGTTPHEAFNVSVGLGETMSPEDILEGRMFVQISLAIERPAEFITLSIEQQMQTA